MSPKEIYEMNFTGNLIPLAWYHKIVKPNGKPHMNAIAVLAELLFWSRPVKDLYGLRNKYNGDRFRVDYKRMSLVLNLTGKDIQRALAFLESKNLLMRSIARKSVNGNMVNLTYIILNFEELKEINNFQMNVDNSVDNLVETV